MTKDTLIERAVTLGLYSNKTAARKVPVAELRAAVEAAVRVVEAGAPTFEIAGETVAEPTTEAQIAEVHTTMEGRVAVIDYEDDDCIEGTIEDAADLPAFDVLMEGYNAGRLTNTEALTRLVEIAAGAGAAGFQSEDQYQRVSRALHANGGALDGAMDRVMRALEGRVTYGETYDEWQARQPRRLSHREAKRHQESAR